MALASYSDLIPAIADWMERGSLSAAAACVEMAEASMNRTLRLPRMMQRSTNTAVDAEYKALPSDFLELISLVVVGGNRLDEAPQDVLEDWASCDTTARQPTHFSIVGSGLRFWPPPDTAYSARITYFQKIPALSDANQTNWLLDRAPDAYLYGALMHAGPYLRDPEGTATFAALHRKAIDELTASNRSLGGKLRTEAAQLLNGNYDPDTRYA